MINAMVEAAAIFVGYNTLCIEGRSDQFRRRKINALTCCVVVREKDKRN